VIQIINVGIDSDRFMGRAIANPFHKHLQQVTFFSAFSRKDLRKVAKRSKDRQVAAGTTIVKEGDNGDEFFVILDGTVSVSRQGRKVATLGPGSGFGELALLLDNVPRNATVVADTDIDLAVTGTPLIGVVVTVPVVGLNRGTSALASAS